MVAKNNDFCFFTKKCAVTTKEEFLTMAANRCEELKELEKLDNSYHYAKSFVFYFNRLNKHVFRE